MRSGGYSKWWAAPAADRVGPGGGSTRLDAVQAVGVLAVFALSMVGNVLATSADHRLVKYSNTAIANTHPVYGLPAGYAFAIWGLIYLLEAVFVLYQLLPMGGLSLPAARAARSPAAGVFMCNVGWLALFGNEQYWAALMVILLYDYLLFCVLARLDAQCAVLPPKLPLPVILTPPPARPGTRPRSARSTHLPHPPPPSMRIPSDPPVLPTLRFSAASSSAPASLQTRRGSLWPQCFRFKSTYWRRGGCPRQTSPSACLSSPSQSLPPQRSPGPMCCMPWLQCGCVAMTQATLSPPAPNPGPNP